ncbi:MAG: pyridoxal-dependent decarboxylase [Proteobacteria bacterium]|jgi:aromatic-L-amino-acid decarboxylase|nr:pyridoxal-dependent decarboxylase [Pseudomonadota bacterium]
MKTNTFPLEPSVEEIDRMLDETRRRILTYFTELPSMPADRSRLGLAKALASSRDPASAPDAPRALGELLDELFAEVFPLSLNAPGAGYMAYVPGGGLFASALADLLAKTVNRYVGVNFAAPLLSKLEADVVKWFCGIVGFPDSAKGILTTGGSIANLTAVVAARAKILGEDVARGVLYASEETHHSVWKAAQIAGIFPGRQRRIPITDGHAVDLERLRRAIAADRDRGLAPFLVIGNAGTTDTGSVDPLPELREIADDAGLWLHVDGAYGAFFAMTERGRARLRGMAAADSVTLDPHKGLFLPYGTGALLVRDGRDLERPFRHKAAYLTEVLDDGALWDFGELSIELSREARGVRVWLPFQLYGAGAFADALDEKLDLALHLRDRLAGDPDCRIPLEPGLSLVVFRYEPASVPKERWDDLNERILKQVNALNRVHLSGTTTRGEYVLRACILSFRTHREQIDMLVEDLETAKRGSVCDLSSDLLSG